jgi:hypothetical protein
MATTVLNLLCLLCLSWLYPQREGFGHRSVIKEGRAQEGTPSVPDAHTPGPKVEPVS